MGSIIRRGGGYEKDIRSRIAQDKQRFMKYKKLLTSRRISVETRKRFIKTYVWSVFLYGSETWTILEVDKRRIVAFETWCYRRMLKISYIDRVTNEEVFRRINERPELWATLKRRRDVMMGHVLRHDDLTRRVVEGIIDGQNRRGRPRKSYVGQIV